MPYLSLQLTIAGKNFTLRALPEEEDLLRTAAAQVTERMTKLGEKGLKDPLDQRSITAFDFAVELLRLQKSQQTAASSLSHINRQIQNAITP